MKHKTIKIVVLVLLVLLLFGLLFLRTRSSTALPPGQTAGGAAKPAENAVPALAEDVETQVNWENPGQKLPAASPSATLRPTTGTDSTLQSTQGTGSTQSGTQQQTSNGSSTWSNTGASQSASSSTSGSSQSSSSSGSSQNTSGTSTGTSQNSTPSTSVPSPSPSVTVESPVPAGPSPSPLHRARLHRLHRRWNRSRPGTRSLLSADHCKRVVKTEIHSYILSSVLAKQRI